VSLNYPTQHRLTLPLATLPTPYPNPTTTPSYERNDLLMPVYCTGVDGEVILIRYACENSAGFVFWFTDLITKESKQWALPNAVSNSETC